ncbi:inner membrane protein YohC [Klebsiella pneumoniae]|uniref:Inner membrane protein YohC n=1 Tax=Klebsiella pneumoniae TaxID=573 RepID=A0A4P0YAY8_KLEPN|nr:inner membrane protein YohC [Klebsiella pneumoniae]
MKPFSHHYTHHVLLMAAVPVICAFIGTTQLGWNFGDGTVIKTVDADRNWRWRCCFTP